MATDENQAHREAEAAGAVTLIIGLMHLERIKGHIGVRERIGMEGPPAHLHGGDSDAKSPPIGEGPLSRVGRRVVRSWP